MKITNDKQVNLDITMHAYTHNSRYKSPFCSINLGLPEIIFNARGKKNLAQTHTVVVAKKTSH